MPQTLVITGVTGGIGRAIARRMVCDGWRVVGLGRNEEKLNALAKELGAAFRQIACDVRDRAAVREAAGAIVAEEGPPDVVVNNAGLVRPAATHEVSDEDIDAQLETVLTGAIVLTAALLPAMIEKKSGLVVNIGSVAGERAAPKMAVYGAAKSGLIHLTRSLAAEYAGEGIRAVCINPGAVETGLLDKMLFAMIQKKTPLKRLAQPEEIASLVAYLTSPEASFITGSSFTIDGGVGL